MVSCMTLEQMQEKKKRLGYTYQQIALLSGVPKTTVQKVLGGVTKNPRTNTMKALENALDSHELGEISEVRYTPLQKNVTSLRDEALQYDADMYMEPTPRFHIVPEWAKNQKYPKQGSYTLADYLALPDGQRAELIEGVIYDMASSSAVHQDILLDIAVALKEASKKHTECRVYTPPYDVQLNADDRTIVQPDVFAVCHKDRLSRKRVIGAPDLVIEVMSPSTRKKDIEIKYGEYAQAGVREYWMVDPDRMLIYVTVFAADDIISIYTFDEKVPVWISDGEVSVDFAEIKKDIAYVDTLREV